MVPRSCGLGPMVRVYRQTEEGCREVYGECMLLEGYSMHHPQMGTIPLKGEREEGSIDAKRGRYMPCMTPNLLKQASIW